MRSSSLFSWILLVSFMCAVPAQAGSPLYLFGKLGTTNVDAKVGDSFEQLIDGDDDSKAYGLGLRFGKYLAFEAQVADFGAVPGFGTPCSASDEVCIAVVVPVEAETTAISVSVLPQYPFSDRLFVYAKLGIISWESDLSEVLPDVRNKFDQHDDEDLVYGAGVRFLLSGSIGLFAEVERFADSFDTVSLGATLGF